MYIFNTLSKLQTNKFTNIVNKKKLNILDYGCGVGIWSKEDIKNKDFKKITLFDKNKKLINFLTIKYNNKKIEINFDKKKILNKKNYDLVIFSSVIQYMSKDEIKLILKKLKKNSSKTTYLMIDIPKYHRIVEYMLLPFFNIKRFLFSTGLIFNKEYKKIKRYHHQLKDFDFLKKNYEIKKISNLYDVKFLRYTLVITEK
jgi:2-polyprenyl-3-methyl-5-hydroxy-6-metoxy-1,4-benzoquinol methylase